MDKLKVIKIGGHVTEDQSALPAFLKIFSEIKGKKILVHGGGKQATVMANQLGIRQQLINGRRVTDAETLKLVTMTYAGYINKHIVAALQALNCNAIGLCGADANIIPATKRPVRNNIDYGFVGDINEQLPLSPWELFLNHWLTPVISAITHDQKGQLLNTNADTIANEIARSLSEKYEVSLFYLFEKPGVLYDKNDENSVLKTINEQYYRILRHKKIISEGMIPKLENAFSALHKGVHTIKIGKSDELLKLLKGNAGTSIIH